MISVLCSKFDYIVDLIKDELKKYIKSNMKVVILPWSFPVEINYDLLENDFFKKGERRYNKYVNGLIKLGLKEENITVLNCYDPNKNKIKEIINQADILVLTGGNPEMMYAKVVQECECLYEIKHFKGIIIGESAGCLLQQKRYFITAKNNFYKYFAFYDGFGAIENDFYMDVHTINNTFYQNKLKEVAKNINKPIYEIYDNGCVIYNRSNKNIKCFGSVKVVGK